MIGPENFIKNTFALAETDPLKRLSRHIICQIFMAEVPFRKNSIFARVIA